MESYESKIKTNDRMFIIIGFVVIGIIFTLYSNVNDFSITPESTQAIERLAVGFYIVLLMQILFVLLLGVCHKCSNQLTRLACVDILNFFIPHLKT